MSRYDGSEFGFENLEVYRAACAFRRRIYSLTKALPSEEKYGLASQMRRAAVSLTANIAEGYGRHHWQESMQFCRHSRGSLMELVDQANVCLDEAYLNADDLRAIRREAVSVLRLLNGYIAYLNRQKNEDR